MPCSNGMGPVLLHPLARCVHAKWCWQSCECVAPLPCRPKMEPTI